MRRRSFLGILPGALALAAPQPPESGREAPLPNRPRVLGTMALRARARRMVSPTAPALSLPGSRRSGGGSGRVATSV